MWMYYYVEIIAYLTDDWYNVYPVDKLLYENDCITHRWLDVDVLLCGNDCIPHRWLV